MLLSHNLSLLHSCLLFSPPSQRVSLYCFRIFFPLNFDSSPVSLHPPFLKTLFSPFLCASHWCSSLLFPWCFFPFVSWFVSHYLALVLNSLGLSFSQSFSVSHTHTDTLFSQVACRSQLACLSVSCRVTKLLDSYQLSGWPISAQAHSAVFLLL